MNTPYSKPLPFWLEAAYARQTPSAWIVTLYARTHGIGHGKALSAARIRLRRHFECPDHAINWATGTPTAKKLRTTANGCWLLHQIKAKWNAETRHEILASLGKELRAKYDGINYLYESDEAQSELQRVLKLQGMFAMNYPVGLVPKPQTLNSQQPTTAQH